MNQSDPKVVAGVGLAVAWAKAFLPLARHEAKEYTPLVLRITGLSEGQVGEDDGLRNALDAYISMLEKQKGVETVANTIFPQLSWVRANGDRQTFFNGYRKVYPRIIKLDPQNRKGTYFGRLIEGLPNMPEGQLEHILRIVENNSAAVRMKLQASVFDANRDHERGARMNFPCMQQISFAPHAGLLSVNAFYASQQLLLKGYGNYLGLIHLGQFVASQMKLRLDSINVLAGIAKIGDEKRSTPEFQKLVEEASRVVALAEEER